MSTQPHRKLQPNRRTGCDFVCFNRVWETSRTLSASVQVGGELIWNWSTLLHSLPSCRQLPTTPGVLLSIKSLAGACFLLRLYCLSEILSLFKHTEGVIDYFLETCRENMIFLCAATWACISCLQIVICWQGLCHDTTHLSLPSAAGEQQLFFSPPDGLKSAAASTSSSSAFTSSPASSWMRLTNAHTSIDTKYIPGQWIFHVW